MKPRKPLRSQMGWSSPDRIVVRGHDLPGELLGKIDLGGMAFLEILGRRSTPQEADVFNALLVTLVEHGMTPQAIATASVRPVAPSLELMLRRCDFTVNSERNRRSAITLLRRPKARSLSTCDSRELSASSSVATGACAGSSRQRDARSRPAASGCPLLRSIPFSASSGEVLHAA